jgi:maleate isomerase
MYGRKGRIGLAVLDIDLCIEADLRRVLPEGVEIHAARVSYPHEVTPEAMEIATSRLGMAVESLLPVMPKSIVWACTSGSFYGGKAGNEKLMQQLAAMTKGIPATTASGAVVAALEALGCKRPAVGTPYSPEINRRLGVFLNEHGFDAFPVAGYFDRLVDDITLQTVEDEEVAAFMRSYDRPEADAVVLSCTGLPTARVVASLERELGKPIVTSNLAILWHAMRIGGIRERVTGAGRLFDIA